jgi:hypothetical protein
METEDVGALVERAVVAACTATGPATYETVRELLERVAAEGAVAVGIGVGMLGAGDAVVRATGCELLGLVCTADETFGEEVATALLACAASVPEADVDVRWSLAGALGATRDVRAAPVLVGWAEHSDSGVRRQVASGLPWVATGDPDGVDVRALIALTRDADAEVRNWAAFGLGSILEVDTGAVRAALWDRVEDEFEEARAEGIRGLARRHDRRAVPLLAALLAGEDGAHPLNFQAAQLLGAPELLPHLAKHDPQAPGLDAALAECDPAIRERRDESAGILLAMVDEELPHAEVGLCGHRFDAGLVLEVAIAEEARSWFVEPLLARADGDPRQAAALVLADLR